jgi:MFS superfamily sulfate permease-like transporter
MSFEALYQSGNIAFVILVLMAVEAVLLSRFFKRLPGLLTGLVAGACFVLALRAALLQQSWMVIGSFLALAFVFHVTEVWQWLRLTKTQS